MSNHDKDLICAMCGKLIKTPSPVYIGWCSKCDERYGFYTEHFEENFTYEPIKRQKVKRGAREE